MLPQIEISNGDIATIAQELGLDLSDPEKVAVIRETESCDIQAGPGSGKTTILVAKLAILVHKWPFRDRGICVLSHTNVARREIEQRLSKSAALRRLLHYPHFVGTYQTFVDRFLAIPYLRREGIEIVAVDNERFQARALNLFEQRRFMAARSALSRRYNGQPERMLQVVGGLRFEGADLQVTNPLASTRGFPGPGSLTGQQLAALKQLLRDNGYFRFDDMFAFAEACLRKVSYISSAIRQRFPWVMVDELQDTSNSQDRIVEHLFAADECVLQRFGDKNQAIFDFDEDSAAQSSLFDRRKTLYVNSTYRFGTQIGKFVSQLTAVDKQTIVGNTRQQNCRHMVFIYSRDKKDIVVPGFGDLVLNQLNPKAWQRNYICVVGSRKNEGQHRRDNFPASLVDYWRDYISPKASKPESPDTLLGYVVEARAKGRDSRLGNDALQFVFAGVLALCGRAGSLGNGEPPKTRTALQQFLVERGQWTEFQRVVWALVSPTQELSEDRWKALAPRLAQVSGVDATSQLNEVVANFLAWHQIPSINNRKGATQVLNPNNTYLHRSGQTVLPIRFESIHGVKGETHAATLVVETFVDKQHDIKAVLPALTGDSHGSELAGGAIGHCKRLFVGMSRARELLCLAIPREHINDIAVQKLRERGWAVELLI